MPYIIETKTPARDRILGKQWHHVDYTAVATLDEARSHAGALCDHWNADYQPFEREARRLPESGGTIGPLPDGTVIEVRQVSRNELSAEGGYPTPYFKSTDALIAAFNAA
jgi:hypothetical protein